MKHYNNISTLKFAICSLLLAICTSAYAQQHKTFKEDTAPVDSIDLMMARIDSLVTADSIINMTANKDERSILQVDSTKRIKAKRDWSTWKPDPQRALWLALVLPGAGQIYNRKYWKLPIVYGGFMGCIYAMTWNNMMYKDYSQAYLDIMDDDPNTNSYNKFLHLGMQINSSNEERYKQIFKSRKDKYRRWRDMSFFVMVGVYALSVIDAYVDAELSVFDISKDLSLKVKPTVIPNHNGGNPLTAQSLGVNCSLNF
ncbi:hypothetical protein CIK96_07435 [Prevotella sp. P4-98]|nr:hypothetical protein CIK96_07435 [Prevotella sp. P4-98]